jgi:hypothetical protein
MAVIMACGATAAWLNLRSRAAPAALRDAVAAD